MKVFLFIAGLLGIFIALPISLWLQYEVLKRVNASELMMFLFWVNVPLIVFIQIVLKVSETIGKKES